jgi:hypothetical protein
MILRPLNPVEASVAGLAELFASTVGGISERGFSVVRGRSVRPGAADT